MTTYKVFHDDENHMSIDAKTPYQAASIYADKNKNKIDPAIITTKPPRGKKSLFRFSQFEDGTIWLLPITG